MDANTTLHALRANSQTDEASGTPIYVSVSLCFLFLVLIGHRLFFHYNRTSMSRRSRRQWCYWLSLGAVTLVFCIHWMRDNANTVAKVKARREHVLSSRNKAPYLHINIEYKKPKLTESIKISMNESFLSEKNASTKTVQNLLYSKSHKIHRQPTPLPQLSVRRSKESHRDQITPSKHDPMKRRRVIILMAQRNSESSLVRQMFTTDRNTMLLDEPLFPFGLNCSDRGEHKTAVLEQLLSCNFTKLPTLYAIGFNLTGIQDNAKCVENGLCFVGQELMRGYSETCNRVQMNGTSAASDEPKASTCGFPLKETILHELCENAKVIVAKVTRVCTVDELQDVFNLLMKKGVEPYIIHMVKDPRSTIFPLAEESTNNSVTEGHAVCARIRKNLNLINEQFTGEIPKLIRDGRYMRIRFEDMETNEIVWAKKIYRFIGVNDIPLDVKNFLLGKSSGNTTEPRKSDRSKSNETLDSSKEPVPEISNTIDASQQWRSRIPFEMVSAVQEDCLDVMKDLGYVSFTTDEELRNASMPFFRQLPKFITSN